MQTLNFQQPLAGMIVAGLIDVDTVRPEIKAGRYIVRSTNCFNQDELPDFSKQELLNNFLFGNIRLEHMLQDVVLGVIDLTEEDNSNNKEKPTILIQRGRFFKKPLASDTNIEDINDDDLYEVELKNLDREDNVIVLPLRQEIFNQLKRNTALFIHKTPYTHFILNINDIAPVTFNVVVCFCGNKQRIFTLERTNRIILPEPNYTGTGENNHDGILLILRNEIKTD